jgi:hypothetical protein
MLGVATEGVETRAGVDAGGASVVSRVEVFISDSDSGSSTGGWTFCGAEGGGEDRGIGSTGLFFHSVSNTF